MSLELTGEFGKRDSTPWFSRIIALAAHPSGLLAVADQETCTITLIDTNGIGPAADGAQARRVGGCGGGPGEFIQLDYLTFHHDTLVVFDRVKRELAYLDLLGNEIRRLRPEILTPTVPYFASLSSLGKETLLGGLHLIPASDPGADHKLLAIVDASDGSTLRRFVTDSPMSQNNPRNLLRAVRACANAGSGEVRAVVANVWGPQVVTFVGEELTPQANVAHKLEWWLPWADARSTGWLPPNPHPGLACGQDHFLVMYKRQELLPDGWIITDALVDVRSYDGDVVHRAIQHAPSAGSIYMYTAAAAAGNRFYVYTNYYADHPVVREYTLVEDR